MAGAGTELGLDRSGNGNNFAANGTLGSDQMVDTPTNNFSTINPVSKMNNGAVTLSEGNLKFNLADNGMARSSIHVSSGKWYWEALLVFTDGANLASIGVSETGYIGGAPFDNGAAFNGYIYINNGTKNSSFGDAASYGATYAVDDIIGVALDLDNGTIAFYKNNSAQGTAFTSVDRTYGAFWSGYGNTDRWIVNFGQDSSFAGEKTAQGNQDSGDIGDFYYTPPSGFKALCTSNLPEPAVKPAEHFNTVLWGGTSASHAITGVGFQPDWVWIKHRNHGTAHQHNLFDAVRGVNKTIHSNSNEAEESLSDKLNSFNADGFTIGNADELNDSGVNYVGWTWKANGSGSSNTNGSINTTATSANTSAGFSISTYTGTGSNATIGHGLSKAPEMVICKRRSAAEGWATYHYGMASDAETDFMELHTDSAISDSNTRWNDTAPTSTVFSIGTHDSVNASNSTYVAYCFHSVEGYSKLGFLLSNNSTDGTFINTGFRPKFLFMRGTFAADWTITDKERELGNPFGQEILFPNGTNTETTYSSGGVDFLSNGFKVRTRGDGVHGANSADARFIYMAFAEVPFKYANAR